MDRTFTIADDALSVAFDGTTGGIVGIDQTGDHGLTKSEAGVDG